MKTLPDYEFKRSEPSSYGAQADLDISLSGLRKGRMVEEREPAHRREIVTASGETLQYVTYYDGDARYEDLTANTIERRTERYVTGGIWESREVDDPVRGKNVEFVSLSPDGLKPVASLRKIHADSWEDVQKLPSFVKFNETESLTEETKQYLKNLVENNKLVEIAALFGAGGIAATGALLGCTLGDSIKKGEVWFMGVVPRLYAGLRVQFGDEVVETIGKPTDVNDGLASEKIAIHPVVVNSREVPKRMFQDIDNAINAGDERKAKKRTAKLKELAMQFDFDFDEHFDPETASRLRSLLMSETTQNPYERKGVHWSDSEAERLKSMDALQAAIARADLTPVLDGIAQGSTVLDIGAGTGTTVEELCRERGIKYAALDVNSELLDRRPDSADVIKIHASSDATGLKGASMDVTYSKAVTAWNRAPEAAITEQLRVTKPGGQAVFTEFDWSVARPGVESSSEEAELLVRIRGALREILGKSGFKPDYGQHLAQDIDSVIEATGVGATREETRHLFPEGDHRELLLGAAEGLGQLASMHGLLSEEDLDRLGKDVAAFKELPQASFFVPGLTTQKVSLHPVDS